MSESKVVQVDSIVIDLSAPTVTVPREAWMHAAKLLPKLESIKLIRAAHPEWTLEQAKIAWMCIQSL